MTAKKVRIHETSLKCYNQRFKKEVSFFVALPVHSLHNRFFIRTKLSLVTQCFVSNRSLFELLIQLYKLYCGLDGKAYEMDGKRL